MRRICSLSTILASLAVLCLPTGSAGAGDDHSHHQAAISAPGETSRLSPPNFPDVPLVDQDGNEVRFYSDLIADRLVVINFVFTTCTTICPPMGAIFAKLQQNLSPEARAEVRLVSVSVDPLVDSPERLAQWSRRFGRSPGWTLLTGKKHDVDQVLKALQVFTPDKIDHAPLVLVGDDRNHSWLRTYGLAPASTLERMVEDLRSQRQADASPAATGGGS